MFTTLDIHSYSLTIFLIVFRYTSISNKPKYLTLIQNVYIIIVFIIDTIKCLKCFNYFELFISMPNCLFFCF